MSQGMARVALVVAIVLSAVAIPQATPAGASHSKPVTVCAVSGAVDVTAVGQIPPGAPADGYYSFFNLVLVCAGGLTGVSDATSYGYLGTGCGAAFYLPGTLGQFCGTYSTMPVIVGGACWGRIGGPGVWNTGGVIGPWSLTAGNVITGWIDCDHGGDGDTAGAIALAAVPMAPNSQANSVLNNDGGAMIEFDVGVVANNRDCADTGPADWPDPILDLTGEPQFWFCRLLVSGVAVIAD